MDNLAISIKSLGKMYKLFRRPTDKIAHVLGFDKLFFWKGTKKNYQEYWALRDLSLSVKQGERLGIIGHNGAGKSTLLKIITGNIAPTEGSAQVSGNVQALLELGTGFHPEFTGIENIRASLAYHGLSTAEIREKEEDIIDFAELEEFIHQPVKTYSAGMYARLAFATATSVKPEILIIDEVLGAGDAYFAGKCVERMRNLTEESGATVLLVSHDLGSIQKFCTRVIWMKTGKILMEGKPHEVVKDYIEYMQHENEIRLRAREMALSRKQAKMILPDDGGYTKYLFRLRTTSKHPFGKHRICKIALRDDHDSPISHIDVGGAMDNDYSQVAYLIDDTVTADWTSPQSYNNEWVRFFTNCGGKDGHAPFLLSIPGYLWNSAEAFSLSIDHGGIQQEDVIVEIWDGQTYVELGKLANGPVEKSFNSVFPLPLKRNEMTISENINNRTEVEEGSEEIQNTAKNNNEKQAVLEIVSVDFVVNEERSKRIIPVGQDLRVDINYDAKESIKNPVFALTFHGLDGTQMSHQNNKLLNIEVGQIYGRGTASFVFHPFRLGPGDYLVTVAVLKYLDLNDWNDAPPAYDRHDRRYCISVFNDQMHGKNLGLVVQESSFTILQP